ncbi:MAG: carboxylating nicotinate-nucleotide diphosphorylase [Oligoflexia bacterium]|nr:carboxylating nicotinate-nucleotide diphosphorylase [Oligoflexia bacterium]
MDLSLASLSSFSSALNKILPLFLQEDGIDVNDFYWKSLPTKEVSAVINFKTPGTVIAGLPFFFAVLSHLEGREIYSDSLRDGQQLSALTSSAPFVLSLRTALTGERLALNLLQRGSAVATVTRRFVDLVARASKLPPIAIMETRKTTPGLRFLEKYAVRVGGGYNHRFTQTDVFMIKDNHKNCLGGLSGAWKFFKEMQSFYTPIVVEIHSLEELQEAIRLNVKHVMLDNFHPKDLLAAVQIKPSSMTFEISGGITFDNIKDYLVPGVDAISVGALTNNWASVDISFKYHLVH